MRFYECLPHRKIKMAARGEIPGNKENNSDRARQFIKRTY